MNILSCPFTGQEASWNRNLFTANQKKNFPRPDDTDASGNREKEIKFTPKTYRKKRKISGNKTEQDRIFKDDAIITTLPVAAAKSGVVWLVADHRKSGRRRT